MLNYVRLEKTERTDMTQSDERPARKSGAQKKPGRFAQAKRQSMMDEARYDKANGSLKENKPLIKGLALSFVAVVVLVVVLFAVVSVVGVDIA